MVDSEVCALHCGCRGGDDVVELRSCVGTSRASAMGHGAASTRGSDAGLSDAAHFSSRHAELETKLRLSCRHSWETAIIDLLQHSFPSGGGHHWIQCMHLRC